MDRSRPTSLRRLLGGRGVDPERHGRSEAKTAPRWPPPAAAATLRALRQLAIKGDFVCKAGPQPALCLAAAYTSAPKWAALMRALTQELSAAQMDAAVPILTFHKALMKTYTAGQGSLAAAHKVVRVIRRRAQECPSLPTIGVPPAAARIHQSFDCWIEDPPAGSLRGTPSDCGPKRYSELWHLKRVEYDGVVCFGRAACRVSSWRRAAAAGPRAPPPMQLARAVVHANILPTALTSRPDHYWLTAQERYMSVREVSRAMGLSICPRLMNALDTVPCPTVAVSMLGAGIHATVALLLLRLMRMEGLLPAYVRYASVCSGIDCFAAALDFLTEGKFSYEFAAERETRARTVLQRAWGLEPRPPSMYTEAAELEQADLPPLDLCCITPSCLRLSRRRHERDAMLVAQGILDAAEVCAVVRRRAAAVVVVENVAEPDAIAGISLLLKDIGGYTWRMQILSPLKHGGEPVERVRAIWLGVRV